MYGAAREFTGTDIEAHGRGRVSGSSITAIIGIPCRTQHGKGKLVSEMLLKKIPNVICSSPPLSSISRWNEPANSKQHRKQQAGLVERFELFANGKRSPNACSRLNDPLVQQERFEAQLQLMERGDGRRCSLIMPFLRALECCGCRPPPGSGSGSTASACC